MISVRGAWVPAAVPSPTGVSAGREIVINLCGEGEVEGAINVNNLVACLRPLPTISSKGPFVRADIQSLPFADNSVDRVIGNRMPFLDQNGYPMRVAREAFRVLKPGATATLHASSGSHLWLPHLREAGFVDVSLVAGFAVGRKLAR